jgi:outer membrane protein assembly factor BamB
VQNWPLEQLFAMDVAGGKRAAVEGQVAFSSDPVTALVFDGTSSRLSSNGIGAADLPKREFTVECCVALDAPQPWGGLVGYLQDNGDDEKGWLLGYINDTFCLALSTHGKLTYLKAKQPAVMGRWYHLVGTYDGQEMRVYLNGHLESTSTEQAGDVDYPPKAVYTIGAYRDDNENFLFKGKLRDIRLFDRAPDADWVRARADTLAALLLQPLAYSVPPRVLYLPGGAVDVLWDLPAAVTATLEYSPRDGAVTRLEAGAPATHFAVRLTGLARDTEYTVRIRTTAPDGDRVSAPFSFDTTFNYERPPVPAAVAANPAQARLAARLIPDPDRARGMCLVYGLADGRLALEIARRSRYRVSAWDDSPERVASVRRFLLQAGVYGQQVTVQRTPSLTTVPVAGGIADLLVSEACGDGRLPGSAAEILRLLRPGGGRAELGPLNGSAATPSPADLEAWLAPCPVKSELIRDGEQTWARLVRPPLSGAGAWTHQYGDPGNSANSWDALLGATGTADFDTQWLGRPGADFGIDRNPRMPAPLVANGRLFHQGMNRLAAINAFNGSILWTLEVPDLRRVNLPRDAGNWCADDESLFVAVADCCLQLEAATGAERQVFHLPEAATSATHEWGWVAQASGLLLGSSNPKGAAYREFWGGAAWYDARTGAGTEKVCSDAVFAWDRQDSPPRTRWVHAGQAILNATLTIADGAVLFAESRNPALAKPLAGRHGDELWKDLFLVCLDLETGNRRWETAIEAKPGTTVVFLSAVPGAIVLTASADGEYRLTCFEPASGAGRWSAAHPWPSDNHGGHLQHPVLNTDTVFLEPHAYDLKTGVRQPGTIGKHEGCATYAGTRGALLYRGLGRCVALWDTNTGAVTTWRNLRPSCWLNTVAGGGLILVPEGGGGCSCGNWLETSLCFAPHALQQGGLP